MELTRKLERLGLTRKEAEVYITLLSLGKATGYQVAKESTFDRSTTYFLLRELRKKGLVLQLPDAAKQFFIAKDPREFIETKKQEIHSAESILPQLLKLTQIDRSPRTLHFDGAIAGAEESLLYVLQRSKEKLLHVFVSYTPGGPTGEIMHAVETNMQHMQRHSMQVRAVVPEIECEVFLPLYKKYGWEIRIMPQEKYQTRSSFSVCDTYVRVASRGCEMGVVMDNEEIAEIAKTIFESMWIQGSPTLSGLKQEKISS